MSLFCGAGKADLTPDIDISLAGYAGNTRRASGIHDPIYSRVIVLQNEQTTFVFVSLDLVGIDRFYYKRLTEQIYQTFGISSEQVFIHATHTHSGPGGIFHQDSLIAKAFPYMNGYSAYQQHVVEEQHEKIIQAIGSAVEQLQPCEIFYGEGVAKGIATNRNDPKKPYDSKLRVVEFRYDTGESAILYHFACHPTILDPKNVFFSADLPGVTSTNLEAKSDIQLALYVNGPSADISTRYTRRKASFSEVDRLGKKLADGVKTILPDMLKTESEPLISISTDFHLNTRKIANVSFLEEQKRNLMQKYERLKETEDYLEADLRQLESQIEGVATTLDIGEKFKGIDEIETQLQFLRIGKIIFVSVPGEFYFESGKEITDAFEVPILIAGNTNDHLGYIVPSHYYSKGYYESYMTLLEADSDEKIKTLVKETIENILNKK